MTDGELEQITLSCEVVAKTLDVKLGEKEQRVVLAGTGSQAP